MNHAELSRDLALALGWEVVRISASGGECLVKQKTDHGVRVFDYRDPSVALAMVEYLAHELDCSIACGAIRGGNFCVWHGSDSIAIASAKTLPEAVARAVIALKGKK